MTTDAFEMALVHRVFRRELGNASYLIGGVAAGDKTRSGLIATHLGHVLAALHHHHAAEEDLLWPKLHTRVSLRDNDVVRMEDQHAGIAESVEKVESLRVLWATSAEPRFAGQLRAAVEELAANVNEHLEDEERNVVPLINEHINADEWAECIERGAAFLPKMNVRMALVFVGLVLQDATPAEQQLVLAGIPLPPRVFWRLLGKRTFESYRTTLYGSADAPQR